MNPKTLSSLEQQVMNIVWDCRQCSVRDVMKILKTSRQLAYTTVATILQRLFEKGVVLRKRQGIAFVYSPKLSKKSYSKKFAGIFLKNFIQSFGDSAIVSFAESVQNLPKEKRKYLLGLLEKYDKGK